MTKAEEKEFYKQVYLLAFDKEDTFFYDNDSDTIFDFLFRKYDGPGLVLKLKLLYETLYSDAGINPLASKKHLKEKAEDLRRRYTMLLE